MSDIESIVEEFWEAFVSAAPIFESDTTVREETVRSIGDLQSILHQIDDRLSFRIKMDIINMGNYEFPESFTPYTSKMNIVRYNLELSCSGDLTMCDLLDDIVEMSDNYTIPDSWIIVKYFTPQYDPSSANFIRFGPTAFVGLGNLKYDIKSLKDGVMTGNPELPGFDKLVDQNTTIFDRLATVKHASVNRATIDNLYDLTIVFPDDLVGNFKTQEDIYETRNSAMEWMESVIGEYSLAMHITLFTIIPQTICTQLELTANDSCTALPQKLLSIQSQYAVKRCKLCKLCDYNVHIVEFTPSIALLEYPYIRFDLCEYCLTLLKNFKPMYNKLISK